MGGLRTWLNNAYYTQNEPLKKEISSPFDIELSEIERDKISKINHDDIKYVTIGSSL